MAQAISGGGPRRPPAADRSRKPRPPDPLSVVSHPSWVGILPTPMRTPLLLSLAAGLLATGTPAALAAPNPNTTLTPSPLRATGVDRDLAALARWTGRGPEQDPDRIVECERLLGDLDRAWVIGQPRSDEIQLALLDFLGRCLGIADRVTQRRSPWMPGEALGARGEPDLRRRATAILARRLPDSRRFLTLEVLNGRTAEGNHPLGRRLAACEVLREDRSPDAVLALLSCTRATPPETEAPIDLVDAAIAALAGRRQAAIHLRLIDLLGRAEAGELPLWKRAIEHHFQSVELAEDEARAVEKVLGHVTGALASEDWRRASRATAIARCLPHIAAFPALIDGLEVWVERAQDPERAVRRVQGEILAELERRSARSLGPRPERWRALWQAHERGEVGLRGEGRDEQLTVGGFFGLRPSTDRVTFVLDRSGSMAASFGPQDDHDRLDEASEQMAGLLRLLGERARFDVVVFSDDARAWRGKLQPASEENVRVATRWVRSGGARGGTHLRAGVHEAMHVDRRGELDLEALEADTIIVLCDGETARGPHWVEPFLRAANDDARVVFFAVQIGGAGDGTLERLCEETGGEFLHVQG